MKIRKRTIRRYLAMFLVLVLCMGMSLSTLASEVPNVEDVNLNDGENEPKEAAGDLTGQDDSDTPDDADDGDDEDDVDDDLADEPSGDDVTEDDSSDNLDDTEADDSLNEDEDLSEADSTKDELANGDDALPNEENQEEKCSIEFSAESASNGSIQVDGTTIDVNSYRGLVENGNSFTFTVTADEGWKVAQVEGAHATGRGNEYIVENVINNIVISINYEIADNNVDEEQFPGPEVSAETNIKAVTPFRANQNYGTIKINVRVFDESNGMVYEVGEDSVAKGNPELIQSVTYRIPNLSYFAQGATFGRVTKVVGNWYFPTGDQQQGASVEWSCNVNNVTMTYWVKGYRPEGGGGESSSLWNFTLKYNANGGSGAPETQTYSTNDKYTKSHTFTISNNQPIRGGYTFKGWAEQASAQSPRYQPGANYLMSQTVSGYNGGSVEKTLYAVWEQNAPVQVTLTYMDRGAQYAEEKYGKGAEVTVRTCTNTRANYTFKGWDTDSKAENVVYEAGDTFTINADTTLYAVWEKIQPKNTSYTVEWYDTDENLIGKKTETRTGTVGTTVEVTEADKAVEGYTFSESDARNILSETLEASGTVLKLYFTKDQPQEVEYMVNWYDTDENLIGKKTETRRGSIGSTVEVTDEDKAVEGYTFDEEDTRNVLSETLEASGTVLKLYFTKDQPQEVEYTVNWYDTDENLIGKKTETRRGSIGSTVEVTDEDKAVEGYTFDEEDTRNVLSETLEASGTVLKLYFTKDQPQEVEYMVNWYDTDENLIGKKTETRRGSIGSTVEVTDEDKAVEGYTFDEEDTRNVLSETLEASGTVLKLYFTKNDPNEPDPENPDPENPDPENPDPENPDPENPDPENPDPENPDPENPDPENPEPNPEPVPDEPEPNPVPNDPEPNPVPDEPEPVPVPDEPEPIPVPVEPEPVEPEQPEPPTPPTPPTRVIQVVPEIPEVVTPDDADTLVVIPDEDVARAVVYERVENPVTEEITYVPNEEIPVLEEVPAVVEIDSPDTVIILDEEVPQAFVKVKDPVTEDYVYIPEEEVPLANIGAPETGDVSGNHWMMLFMMSLGGMIFLLPEFWRGKKNR